MLDCGGTRRICNGKLCRASDWAVDGRGGYAFVEHDRSDGIPLVRVTMAGSEVRFLKVGIDFAPGNA